MVHEVKRRNVYLSLRKERTLERTHYSSLGHRGGIFQNINLIFKNSLLLKKLNLKYCSIQKVSKIIIFNLFCRIFANNFLTASHLPKWMASESKIEITFFHMKRFIE
jgi:hypothetical protein